MPTVTTIITFLNGTHQGRLGQTDDGRRFGCWSLLRAASVPSGARPHDVRGPCTVLRGGLQRSIVARSARVAAAEGRVHVHQAGPRRPQPTGDDVSHPL